MKMTSKWEAEFEQNSYKIQLRSQTGPRWPQDSKKTSKSEPTSSQSDPQNSIIYNKFAWIISMKVVFPRSDRLTYFKKEARGDSKTVRARHLKHLFLSFGLVAQHVLFYARSGRISFTTKKLTKCYHHVLD